MAIELSCYVKEVLYGVSYNCLKSLSLLTVEKYENHT